MPNTEAIHNGKDKISNAAQIGGIETSVLDNGLGRGTRIAWINTGTGLRYKVIIDRAMDIADAFFNEYSLSWLSNLGTTMPERFSDSGMQWIRNFGGGLLTTCGLSHVGGPEKDEFGERGLHGLISNTPAEIISIIQPNPAEGKMDMSITGIVRQTQVFGPMLELKRTISGKLGEAKITINDEVINVGNIKAPHMLLYHINFGWPLVDEETKLLWNGEWESPTPDSAAKIFKKGADFKTCPAPLESHSGIGEDVAFIDTTADKTGTVHCGLHNKKINLAVSLSFPKKQLPWLINWQHWGKKEYVTALEPATNPPIGQTKAREEGSLEFLEPGKSRSYSLNLEVLQNTEIDKFLNNFKK
ncbi:aldose 1-epimerase family protein [Maribacter stanieri]|uniref:Galactose mutarotase n=1 Tax=Maribacter stanieri TaxID=440514 RepID=A0A1I6IJG5_9FLAO|nr:aldose 1-epimerase family protein [Maribacter stanieri]SFR66927.1 protein of unknown function [Maribacter stanieri]